MFYLQFGAKLIKLVLAGGSAVAQTEQPVGEFAALAIILGPLADNGAIVKLNQPLRIPL